MEDRPEEEDGIGVNESELERDAECRSDGESEDKSEKQDVPETRVKVAARVRPLIPKEKVDMVQTCVRADKNEPQIFIGTNRSFTFDHVFAESASQEDVFDTCVSPLIDGFFQGYNATVLAYGQTGAGKTHTMGSANQRATLDADVGIIPRMINALFERISGMEDSKQLLLRVSFLEIYNEEIKDLLKPTTSSKSIAVRENERGAVVVMGVDETTVTTAEEMEACLEKGSLSRTTHSTLMNKQSSRSHSIFTISLEQKTSATEYVSAKFHLVDLAGSERQKKTGNVGKRFKESVTINTGLLALGNVISALGDEKRKATHIPYRQSKLTRLLQNSLGGNSNTLMIACLSPADVNFDETLNTLKYANRAKNIRNKPTVNRNPHALEMTEMKKEIEELQAQLQAKQSEGSLLRMSHSRLIELENRTIMTGHSSHMQPKVEELEREVHRLQGELSEKNNTIRRISEESFSLKSERDTLEIRVEEADATLANIARTLEQFQKRENLRESMVERVEDVIKNISAQRDKTSSDAQRRQLRAEISHNDSSIDSRPATAPNVSDLRRDLEQSHSDITKLTMEVSEALTPIHSHRRRRSQGVVEKHLRRIQQLEDDLFNAEKVNKELKSRLQEAKDDLARDEQIFSEKVKEIKKATRGHKKALAKLTNLEKEYQSQLQANKDLENKLGEMQVELVRAKKYEQAADPSRPRTTGGNPQIEYKHSPRQDMGGSGVMSPMRVVKSTASSSRLIASQIEEQDEVLYGNDLTVDEGTTSDFQSLATDIQVLEKQKEKLVGEKTLIEKEKKNIEEQVVHQAKEYEHSQKEMTVHLRDLNINIRMKEELIKQLVKNEQVAKEAKNVYASKLYEMEEEVLKKQDEIEKLKEKMGREIKHNADGEVEQQSIKEEYERKLKLLGQQLAMSKKKAKEQERYLKVKQQDDRKIYNLEKELTKMKAEQEKLQKRMKDDLEHHELMKNARAREMIALKKTLETGQKRIRDLELENNRQKLILARKQEEMERVNVKLKRQEKKDKDKDTHAADVSTVTATETTAEVEGPEMEKKKIWLEERMELQVKQQEEMAKLQRELKMREEKLKEREEALAQRNNLEFRKMQSGMSVRQSIADLSKTIQGIDQELKNKTLLMSSRSNQSPPDKGIEQAVVSLREKLLEAEHSKALLEAKAERGEFLTGEEENELKELEDEIENLDEEIEYKNSIILKQKKRLEETSERADKCDELENKDLTSDNVKEIIEQYRKKLHQAITQAKDEEKKRLSLECSLDEAKESLAAMENAMKMAELEADRKLTKTQREHENKVQMLYSQMVAHGQNQSSGDGITDGTEGDSTIRDEQMSLLEKDNYYYKQTNRDLKRKLRELVAANDADRQLLEKERENYGRVVAANKELLTEMANLRSHISKHDGFESVRVSLKDLRAIPQKEVAARARSRPGSATSTRTHVHKKSSKEVSPDPTRTRPSSVGPQ